MSDQQPEQPETEDAAETTDVKSKFRAALERKQARSQSGEGHANASSKIHDVNGKVGGKRQFRRKSG
ncbi:MAG: DUF5302 domain-containing protein [Actinomycetota bacterium]|nr:DUF5302 domain-containing protein [Actinomycetota bacterium]MDQ3576874.1 DUF5302 domain-containing protein [Actinomycetota bacterium]